MWCIYGGTPGCDVSMEGHQGVVYLWRDIRVWCDYGGTPGCGVNMETH